LIYVCLFNHHLINVLIKVRNFLLGLGIS